MMKEEKQKSSTQNHVGDGTTDRCFLVLHNDDHNSFDHVIKTLMEILDHSAEQAEQCAYLAHFRGSCRVKNGSREHLVAKRQLFKKNGLTVTINPG